jgi:hypothetical protein
MLRTVQELSSFPLIGSMTGTYAARYESNDQRVQVVRPSEKIRELFQRWSIQFSIEHYAAKEEEEARGRR